MGLAKPNRTRLRRVQERGHSRKRCRRYRRWKKKHGTNEEAWDAAREMQRMNPRFVYKAFKCDRCGWHHVGRDMEATLKQAEDRAKHAQRQVRRLEERLEEKSAECEELRDENRRLRTLVEQAEYSFEQGERYLSYATTGDE